MRNWGTALLQIKLFLFLETGTCFKTDRCDAQAAPMDARKLSLSPPNGLDLLTKISSLAFLNLPKRHISFVSENHCRGTLMIA